MTRLAWPCSAAAVIGGAVVLAVHYGRRWADGTCTAAGDCLGADASLQRSLLVALGVVAAAMLALAAARIRRAWLVALVAFATQGWVMLVVEHADGFWLPLWLDVIVGAAAWGVTPILLRRHLPGTSDPAA